MHRQGSRGSRERFRLIMDHTKVESEPQFIASGFFTLEEEFGISPFTRQGAESELKSRELNVYEGNLTSKDLFNQLLERKLVIPMGEQVVPQIS